MSSSSSSGTASPTVKGLQHKSLTTENSTSAKTPAQIEDALFTKRVIFAEEDLNLCIDGFYKFYDALNDINKDDQSIADMEGMLLEKMEWYQLKASWGRQCEHTLHRDIEIFQQRLVSLGTERENIIKNIGTLTKKLEEAKVKRNHQEEYNIMIDQINKEPPRHVTNQALDELQKKLNVIDEALTECNQTIERRSKQCYAAFSAVQALNRSFSQSDTRKEHQESGSKSKMEVDDANDVKMQ